MGVTVIKLDWWDDRVCRNFLFGTCPHLIFGNTVRAAILSSTLPFPFLLLYMRETLRDRKWTWAIVPRRTRKRSSRNFKNTKRRTRMIHESTHLDKDMKLPCLDSWMIAIEGLGLVNVNLKRRLKRIERRSIWYVVPSLPRPPFAAKRDVADV